MYGRTDLEGKLMPVSVPDSFQFATFLLRHLLAYDFFFLILLALCLHAVLQI